MNILKATPVEIDTRLVELTTARYAILADRQHTVESLHRAIGDRQVYFGRSRSWERTDAEVIEAAAAKVAGAKDLSTTHVLTLSTNMANLIAEVTLADYRALPLTREIERLDAEYRRRPWVRFYQLNSTNGAHIHDNPGCQGLHRSNRSDLGLRPELSGTDTETAVATLGKTLCSKCYPDAPVEWRQDPAAQADPNQCPGAEEYPVEGTVRLARSHSAFARVIPQEGRCTGCKQFRTVRAADGKIGKHAKVVVKANEITNPDGTPLRGEHGVLKTVRSAQIEYVDAAAYVLACDRGYPYTGRHEKTREIAERILTAMAHTAGVTMEAKREELAKKVTARARRDYDR